MAPPKGPGGSTITAGSEVRLISSLSKAMRLCLGQGGWVPQMEATLGKVGVVVEVLSSGNLRIQCGGSLRPYIYPPALIAEHLNAQTGLPLFVLDLHPHSLVRLDHDGHCAVCRRPFEGTREAERDGKDTSQEEEAATDAPQDPAAFLSGPADRGHTNWPPCGGITAWKRAATSLDTVLLKDLSSDGSVLVWMVTRGHPAQCKLQHGPGSKWLNAVVVETLPNSKVRVHVPMEEVPDQELEVTSPKLKPTRTEAVQSTEMVDDSASDMTCRTTIAGERADCTKSAFHMGCGGRSLANLSAALPMTVCLHLRRFAAWRLQGMRAGARIPDGEEPHRVVAYFCPRTAFLLCEKCIEARRQIFLKSQCQAEMHGGIMGDHGSLKATKRHEGRCKANSWSLQPVAAGGAVALALDAARASFDVLQFSAVQGSPGATWQPRQGMPLTAAPLKRGKQGRLLVNVPFESRSQLDEESSDAYSSAAHLYELFTGRSRKPEPTEEEEDDDDWREAELVEEEQEAVQVKMLHGGIRLSVLKAL
ncbi:unnamed protein product [Symbiodinium natans]|uniref:Mind bomb SH3 repeat domain-containing protein n=1 Tax=Symbiodinium natans TaxID=878477 RepID=A0A812NL15_9DINO|nr:unnamed protein product [Symbiodinium natans]